MPEKTVWVDRCINGRQFLFAAKAKLSAGDSGRYTLAIERDCTAGRMQNKQTGKLPIIDEGAEVALTRGSISVDE
ncbi:MAG: hypothetical protein AAFX08_04810 [Pseudomonadota bacterium]